MTLSRPRPAPLDLDDARALGEALLDGLETAELVSRGILAGDARRQDDEVHELQLVVIPLDRGGVFDFMRRVLSPLLRDGDVLHGYSLDRRITITMTDPVHFGAHVLWQTGPPNFLHMLAWRAAGLGLTLRPDGLYSDTGMIAGSAEDHIFTELGVAWIDPMAR